MYSRFELVARLVFLGVGMLLVLGISNRDANAQETIMVEGQITGQDSLGNEKPVSQYPVLVTPTIKSNLNPSGTVTDSNGKFRLFLAPGKYYVVLPENQKKEIEVKKGDPVLQIAPFKIALGQQG